jgi:hypothetical protein
MQGKAVMGVFWKEKIHRLNFGRLLAVWTLFILLMEVLSALNTAFFGSRFLGGILDECIFWSLLVFPNSLLLGLAAFGKLIAIPIIWYYLIFTMLLVFVSYAIGRMINSFILRHGSALVITGYITLSLLLFKLMTFLFLQNLFVAS